MGKGSGRRPLLISEQEAEDNWNRIFGKKKSTEEHLTDSVKNNAELYKQLTQDPIQKPFPHNILRQPRIDTIGQNGNDGLHYEYELNKSTGDVEKRFLEGISKPNEEQFNGRQESNTTNTSETTEGTIPIGSDSGEME